MTRAPIMLAGDAATRGRAQAGHAPPETVGRVIAHRLERAKALLSRGDAQHFLAAQRRFCDAHCDEDMAELHGIASGLDLAVTDLFAFLHLGVLSGLVSRTGAASDGCSAWAVSDGAAAWVGKNRDFHGEQAGVQRLFEHADPAWGARRVLCVGSLGAPGAYSSGMNSDGLVVADTQVATPDIGPGWLRYFLMTRLLRRHASVAAAVDDMRVLRHAGGGTLVLGDASGKVAAVDLGHQGIHVSMGERVARTNHFGAGSVDNVIGDRAARENSEARLRRLHAALTGSGPVDVEGLRALMATHDGEGQTGLCRHGQDGDSRTLSSTVFSCRERTMRHAAGNPCETPWSRHALAPGGAR